MADYNLKKAQSIDNHLITLHLAETEALPQLHKHLFKPLYLLPAICSAPIRKSVATYLF